MDDRAVTAGRIGAGAADANATWLWYATGAFPAGPMLRDGMDICAVAAGIACDAGVPAMAANVDVD